MEISEAHFQLHAVFAPQYDGKGTVQAYAITLAVDHSPGTQAFRSSATLHKTQGNYPGTRKLVPKKEF